MMASAEIDIESLRRSYRPKQTKMLLVGESAPASGKFFYHNSAMTTFTARAFERTYGVTFPDSATFLSFFQECGCYLDDLSLKPVNALRPKERKEILQQSVRSLSQRIFEVQPDVVVAILRRIAPYVRKAVELTSREIGFRVLPFPGNGHQELYIEGLSEILRQYVPERVKAVEACNSRSGATQRA
jgi:hypothetical protein